MRAGSAGLSPDPLTSSVARAKGTLASGPRLSVAVSGRVPTASTSIRISTRFAGESRSVETSTGTSNGSPSWAIW
jgi:hypothetical protein